MSGRGTSDEATDNIILMALAVWHWWQCQFLNSCSQFTKWTPVAKNCTNCFFLPGPTGNTVEYYVDGKPPPHPPTVKDQGHQGVARSASCPSSALATCWLPLLTCSEFSAQTLVRHANEIINLIRSMITNWEPFCTTVITILLGTFH